MPNRLPSPRQLPRDGTSQKTRHLEALDPASAPLDERGLPELLAQVQQLADQLRWCDEQDRCDETWRYLFDPEALVQGGSSGTADPQRPQRIAQNLARLAAYATEPESIPRELAKRLAPPHITLILVVLLLLQRARERLNGLTARHLDFYYYDILQFRPRPAEPDRVHVLVTPARGRRQARLPKDSPLAAGQDASGRERIYVTKHELAVNRARVAELRSLYAEIRITNPAAVRRDHPKEQQFMDLLRLAIGDPDPGDDLPQPVGWPEPNQALFTDTFKAWIDCAREQLHLEFYQLRDLVRRKRIRDNDAEDWALINGVLNAVGERRTGQAFDLQERLGENFDPRNFERNLAAALGRTPDFSGLAEVETMDDLYRLKDRETVREFLRIAPYNALATSDPQQPEAAPVLAPDVVAMMERKQLIDRQWSDINDYLNQAGREYRKDPSFQVADRNAFDPSEFELNLKTALPELDFSQLPAIGEQAAPDSITGYMAVIERIEAYLFMDAESARFLLNRAYPAIGIPAPADEAEETQLRQLWSRTDTLLTEARGRKSIAQRKAALQALREGEPRPAAEQALRTILAEALGLSTENPPVISTLLEAAQPLHSDKLYGSLEKQVVAVTQATATEEDWTELVRLAELIQRARLGEAATQIARHTWIDLHAYRDATQVFPADSPDGSPSDRRWRTFGQSTPEAHPNAPPQPLIGWALSSPVLAMRQGQRRIKVDLHFAAAERELTTEQLAAIRALFPEGGFDSNHMDLSESPLAVDISSAEGWLDENRLTLSVPEVSTREGKSRLTLNLVLEIDASSPAITPPLPELGIDSRWPVLRVRLRSHYDSEIKRFRSPYPALRVLRLAAYECSAQVGNPMGDDPDFDPELGLIEPLLRNDQAPLDPAKPFEPFGPQPAVGSRLAVADIELACKRLRTLRFGLTWMGVPNSNLETYYEKYSRNTSNTKELKNDAFKIQISLVDRGKPTKLGAPQQLFDTKDATQGRQIPLTDIDKTLSTQPPLPDGMPPKDHTRWARYLRWELLDPDFQHAVYPGEAATAANRTTPEVLNPPYTPKLKALSISYSAVSQWDPSTGITKNEGDTLFHLHPFGYSETSGVDTGSISFLPGYDNAGELLIGLTELEPPQRLSLLLQLAEGSADPDLPPAPISWSYLDGDRWVSLDQGQVRRDGTRGLINSGIVELDLSKATPGHRLPHDRYWLRLAAHGQPRSLCDSVAVATQAVSAVFVDNKNDPGHYRHPLPAESITKPMRPIAGIAGIRQPYTSFGGRSAENPEALRTRAGERLRHRNRALSAWDYEHLVLERFPQLHKVKCLAARGDHGLDTAVDLGQVRLVVIPDIARQRPADPFAPKAAARLLKDIQSFLEARLPMGARVQVDNAVFVPVKVRVGIQFHAEFDADLARSELNEALNRYLSPWAYEDGTDMVIGGAIYSNSIIDFLERQPAVDYVQQPKLFRFDAASNRFMAVPEPALSAEDGYHVACGPDQVLVAARQHEIDIILREVEDEVELRGIGYMKIELDFVVAENAT